MTATVHKGLAGLVGVSLLLAVAVQFNDAIGLAPYNIVLMTTALFWITQSTSWNLLSGFAGYFSFGQAAYVGVGAYTTAFFTGRHGVGYMWDIPIAAGLGALLALAIGAVAFRLGSLRGEIFALLTLSVPFILAAYARINHDIDGGQGTTIPLPKFPRWIADFQHLLFYLSLGVATLAVGIALATHRSRFGHGLAAVHDGEDVAEVLGVPTFRYKMVAITLGGALGAMGGALFALQIGFVAVESVFGLTIPLFVIVMSVLGGRRHWLGPVIGAVLLVVLQDRLSAAGQEKWESIVLGALLAGLVVVAADGLYGRLRARRWLALIAFAVVFAGAWLSGYYTQQDALLYAMLAAALVATIVDRVRPAPTVTGATAARADAPPPEPESERIAPQPGGRVLVAVDGLSRDFGGVRALDNVSLEVREGEIVGLVGPNGSGKTTLVNVLSGAMPPSAGIIAIDGRTTNGLAAHKVAHTGVARTYQIPRPFGSMTVRDNVAMAVMFGRQGASLRQSRAAAERHLDTVHLGHLAHAKPDALNLHQRQLLEMARAIAAEPVVLLLDEALAGLNPAEIDDAVRVIRRIHATGISIVIVEHLLRALQRLATRIVVLDRGVLIADGEPATVLSDPAVVSAYLGRQHA
jgi:branched-chain amino acid transport system permease protein